MHTPQGSAQLAHRRTAFGSIGQLQNLGEVRAITSIRKDEHSLGHVIGQKQRSWANLLQQRVGVLIGHDLADQSQFICIKLNRSIVRSLSLFDLRQTLDDDRALLEKRVR